MNISPNITWEILKLAPAYSQTYKCILFLHEKLAIIIHPSQNILLNKKIRNSIQMQIWEQTSILTFRPILITHPSNWYHLNFYASFHKWHYNTPDALQVSPSSIKFSCTSSCTFTTSWHYVSHIFMSVRNKSPHSIFNISPTHTPSYMTITYS